MFSVYQTVGWYGVMAILAAYALVSFGYLDSNGVLYQLLNLTGAIGVVVAAATKRDLQPIVLNTVWATIAGLALWRAFF